MIGMARVVGTWYGYPAYCLNFRPEYRFVKITKRIGKEYTDRTGSECIDVEADTYGYRLVGTNCKPYVYDDWLYLPTVKVGHVKGQFRIYYGKKEFWSDNNRHFIPWDGKTPLVVRERFGHD